MQQGANVTQDGVIEGLTRQLLEQMQREALAGLQQQPGGVLAGAQAHQQGQSVGHTHGQDQATHDHQGQARQVQQTDAQGSDALAPDASFREEAQTQPGATAAADVASACTKGGGCGHRSHAPAEPGAHPQEQRDGYLWFPLWGCWVHEEVREGLTECWAFDLPCRIGGGLWF